MRSTTAEDTRGILEKEIEGICLVNEEIIERITTKVQTNCDIIIYDYLVLPTDLESNRHPYQYKVEEFERTLTSQQLFDEWRVPITAPLPQDPDPEETMYGKHKDLMNMKCQDFSDLVRINQQAIVAKKYTSMLIEPFAITYGQKFKQNFELVQVLLGMLETQLLGTESVLKEKQESIGLVNQQMAQIFAQTNLYSRSDYSFADSLHAATITTAYQLNKGTLLSKGIHQWSVRCVNVVASFDLGVASPSHSTHFNPGTNPPTAWGLRENGHLLPPNSNNGTTYKSGDILSFVLDCTLRSLTISINGRQAATVPNIVLPVHIAFSGGAQARAEIIS